MQFGSPSHKKKPMIFSPYDNGRFKGFSK